MNMHIDIADRQSANSAKYLNMEEPVRQATYLVIALDRLLYALKEDDRLDLNVYREIDAVLSATRVQLETAFDAYVVAA